MSNLGGIPEKIKLADGTEVSVKDNPELVAAMQTAMQNARKEEKDKLYNTIASLEASKKVLEDEKKQNGDLTKSQKEELDRVKEELGAAKAEKKKLEDENGGKEKGGASAKKSDDDKDDKLSKDEVADLIKQALAEQKKESDAQIEKLSGRLNNKNVSDYRKEQLAKYSGELIEDFVPTTLTTEEEVNSAIAAALEKSKQYLTKEYDIDGTKKRMTISEFEAYEAEDKGEGGKEKTPTYTSKEAAPKPPAGGADVDGKELLSRVEDMSDE